MLENVRSVAADSAPAGKSLRLAEDTWLIGAFEENHVARFGFAVKFELKAVDQQGLEHLPKPFVLDIEDRVAKCTDSDCIGIGRPCVNVILFDRRPLVAAGDLRNRNREGRGDESLQGKGADMKSSSRGDLYSH